MRNMCIIESPLKGDTARNRLYALHACRQMYESGWAPIASHLICPWFMDDRVQAERNDGIDWPWMWDMGAPHFFFVDLGMSDGMVKAWSRCEREDVVGETKRLQPQRLQWFREGRIYTCTPGFETVVEGVE